MSELEFGASRSADELRFGGKRGVKASDSSTANTNTINSMAVAIDQARPHADPSVEQFHMMPDSMANTARSVGPLFSGKRIFFLGDDDHMSILFSGFYDVSSVVFEIDPRVVDSLNTWAMRADLRSYSAIHYDVRNDPRPEVEPCDGFFLNPPYSSKNGGHALRVWLSAALDMCVACSFGVILLPNDAVTAWVNETWLDMQRFFSDNGLRMMSLESKSTQMYRDTNDPGLQSEAVYLIRVDTSRRRLEAPRDGSSLYR